MATRKLLFTGSSVMLAGDMNVHELLSAFAEQPVVFEVGGFSNSKHRLHFTSQKHASCVFVNTVCQHCRTMSIVNNNARPCTSF